MVTVFCSFGFFFKAIIVTSVKFLGHSPVLCMFFIICVISLRPSSSKSLSTPPCAQERGEEKNFFPPLGFERGSFQAVTSPCTDSAVSVSVKYGVPKDFSNKSYRYII
jgi:hypothetical protein